MYIRTKAYKDKLEYIKSLYDILSIRIAKHSARVHFLEQRIELYQKKYAHQRETNRRLWEQVEKLNKKLKKYESTINTGTPEVLARTGKEKPSRSDNWL